MASVQDHAPVIKELSERRQQDPQPSQVEQPQPTQGPPKTRDLPDLPRPNTGGSDPLREPSPARFSQLLEPLPVTGTGSHRSRRDTSTTPTNPSTLVNHPGTVSGGTGPAMNSTGTQNAPVILDRYHHQSTSLAPDRRPPILYDPIRGGSVQLSEDGDDRRDTMRRVSIPRPRPIFNLLQDENSHGRGNGSGVALRGVSGSDWIPDPHQPQHPVSPPMAGKLIVSKVLIAVL